MTATLVRAGYTQQPDANKFFEAEAVTTPDGAAERQRTSDPDAHDLLATLGTEATQLLAVAALQALLAAAPTDPATQTTLAAILTRLGDGSVHAHIDNLPATQPVSATALPLPTGAAKDSTLTDGTQRVGGTVAVAGVVSVSGSTAVTGPLTDAQLRASAVPVSGTLTVNVGLTDTQLRAIPVPVSGTVTVTGPLTDAQLRASAVPVSGTLTVTGPLTDTQLRASAVPVSAAALPLPTGAATAASQATANASLASLDGKFPDESGAWDYTSGLTGTVTLSGSKRLLGLTASAPPATAASVQINGGAIITIPAGKSIEFEPRANTTDPTIVFTGTDSYIVEWVV